MLVCDTTFTPAEVEEFLVEDGLSPGTPEYQKEFKRRYLPVCDCGQSSQLYYEHPLWDGEKNSP